MSFPKYKTYKDSGVEWLGDVPEHWNSKRLKFLFNLVKRDVRSVDRIVTCFRDGVVTLRENRRTEGFTNALKEIGYQGVRVGDLVIHAMDAFAGAIGVSDSDGKSSPVYSVCMPASESVLADYYARLLRYMALSGFVTSLAKGIRERSTDFRWSDAGEIFLPVPPTEEQAKIARFLDHETARIDTLIAEQERLIELLKEKRQALISHAVTKGLDSTVPMKDSGIEWLGEVPKHWSIGRIKNLVHFVIDGPHFSPSYTDEGILFISARNVRINGWSFSDAKYISQVDYEEFSKRVKPMRGDVLLTKGGTTGVARAVDFDEPFQVWVHIAVLRPQHDLVTSEYLAYSLNSAGCYEQSQLYTRGATNNDLGLTRIVNIQLAWPSIEEQKKIVQSLNRKVGMFDASILEAKKSMELLQERRSALISAAVTGKIDVRGWQAPASDPPAPTLEAAYG